MIKVTGAGGTRGGGQGGIRGMGPQRVPWPLLIPSSVPPFYKNAPKVGYRGPIR